MVRAVLLSLFALALALTPAAAQGANPAEQFVTGQIRAGLGILNDDSLTAEAREREFEDFLLAATDLKRIALFTLGPASATPAQRDAFAAAFQGYAISVYRSHFQHYSGQSLAVTGSTANGPGDIIVHARLDDPAGGRPLAVDFRVRTDEPKPLVIDVGIAGTWLAVTQHDDFAAFLGRNGGNVEALTAYLQDVAKRYR